MRAKPSPNLSAECPDILQLSRLKVSLSSQIRGALCPALGTARAGGFPGGSTTLSKSLGRVARGEKTIWAQHCFEKDKGEYFLTFSAVFPHNWKTKVLFGNLLRPVTHQQASCRRRRTPCMPSVRAVSGQPVTSTSGLVPGGREAGCQCVGFSVVLFSFSLSSLSVCRPSPIP